MKAPSMSSLHLLRRAEPLFYGLGFTAEVPGFERVEWRARSSWNGRGSGSPEQPSGKHRRSEGAPKVLIGEAVDDGVHCGIHGDQVMGDEPQSAVAIHNLQANSSRYTSYPCIASYLLHQMYLLIYTMDEIRGAVKKFPEFFNIDDLVHHEFVMPEHSVTGHLYV
jgi:hypothetical protein